MKRVLPLGIVALGLMLSQVAHAQENRDAQIKAQMVENYLVWQEAYKNKDAERIISLESPEFTSRSSNGSVTLKPQHDESLRQMLKGLDKVTDAHVAIKKVSIARNRVVVRSKQYVASEIIDDFKGISRVSFTLWTKDIWVEYDGVWMLKRAEELSAKMTVNGKSERL